MCGILTVDALPFTDFTVSALTTRMKPNGRICLILDLSYPHISEVTLGMGVPCSVNKGINKDRYVT